VEYTKETGGIMDTILTFIFGFTTAGLILSTLLTYVSGAALLSPLLSESPAISPLLEESQMMKILVYNQDLWFSLPALLLVAVGFLGSESESS
jgi:hypothetical protein